MTRREAFKSLAAVAGVSIMGLPAEDYRRYGAVSVDRHTAFCAEGVHLHLIYQGKDVSTRCTFADDTGDGWAELFVHDSQGRVCVRPEDGEIAKEIVRGVRFVEGAPFK